MSNDPEIKRNMRDHILMIKKMVYGCSGMNLGTLRLKAHITMILSGQVLSKMVGTIKGKWLIKLRNTMKMVL